MDDDNDNFETFRDCLSASAIAKFSLPNGKQTKKTPRRKRKNSVKNEAFDSSIDETSADNASELSDFFDYLAQEIFFALLTDLRSITYATIQNDPSLAEQYATPLDSDVQSDLLRTLPPSVTDSLCSYSLIQDPSDLDRFLEPVLNNYITAATAPPPEYTPSLSSSRPPGCEICGREHLPLTYHHLIPRQSHVKAVKRGWHKEWELNKVAWLCRACHNYVHQIASNDELAKNLYDVELLLQREDVQRYAAWIGRVRWKAR